MDSRIVIDDDGDEVVYIKINEEIIAQVDHGTFGWAGMEAVINLVENIAEDFGIPIDNRQDIV